MRDFKEAIWPILLWFAWGMLLAAIAMQMGCGPQPPPDHISISSDFSTPEAETIRSAIDDWCDAVGWCPLEVIRAERGRVLLLDDLPERKPCPVGTTCSTAANNDGDTIKVARNRMAAEDMTQLWVAVAHEIGHYCIRGHTGTGLMAEYHRIGDPVEIDQVAINAWRAGCD